jgi:PAS domain S-box-containing protein
VAFTTAAVLIRLALEPLLAGAVPYATFVVAIIASAWRGGLGPGLLATGLGGALAAVLFLSSPLAPVLGSPAEVIGWATYLVVGSATAFLGGRMRSAHLRALRSAAEASAGRRELERELIDRRRVELELEEQRERLAVTLSSIGDAVIVTDEAGRVTMMNAVAESLCGWGRNDAAGRPLAEVFRIVNETTRRTVESPVDKVMREGTVVGLANHTVLLARDGREIPIDDSAAPIRDRGGRLAGVVLVFRDVAERKRAEDLMRRQSEFLERLIDGSPVAVAVVEGADLRFTLANRAYQAIVGPGTPLLGRTYAEVFPEAAELGAAREMRRVVAEGRPWKVRDFKTPVGDREETWWEGEVLPLPGSGSGSGSGVGGGAASALILTWEITDRKRAEEALRERERLLQTVLDNTPTVIFIKDSEGRMLMVNRRFCELAGLPADRIIGRLDRDLFPGPSIAAILANDRRVVAENRLFEFEETLELPDGMHTFLSVKAPMEGVGFPGRVVIGITSDVTERKRSQRERARLAAIVESTSDLVGIAGLDGRILYFNEAGRRMLGLSGGGPEDMSMMSFARPEDHDYVREVMVPAVLREGRWEGRWRYRNVSTGEAVPVLKKVTLLKDPETGEAIGFATVSRDISDLSRLMEERERLLEAERAARAQAEAANRLKDEFLSTLSHELRTPLNAIVGWVQMLRSGTLSPAEALDGLAVIERNAKAQTTLINDLLDISRIMSGKVYMDVRPVDPVGVVRAALDSVRLAAEAKGVRVEAALEPSGEVTGDADRLQQVVWNLLSNAVKFTPKGGRVFARLERSGTHVRITVSDDGQGIDPAFLPHVFERFRQADSSSVRRHGGLGLGLAIVRHLVEMHGGTVRAESDGPGKGATFTVDLPMRAVRSLSPDPAAEGQAAAGGAAGPSWAGLQGLRVLIVDDEADARNLVGLVLRKAGAAVTAAASAAEALALLAESTPDAMVCDIGMPGEDGYSLIRKIRRLAPDAGGRVPAVALTAFARSEDRERALSAGFQMHVPKPVEPNVLTEALAALIGTARSPK